MSSMHLRSPTMDATLGANFNPLSLMGCTRALAYVLRLMSLVSLLLSLLISLCIPSLAQGQQFEPAENAPDLTKAASRHLSFSYEPLTGLLVNASIEPQSRELGQQRIFTYDVFGNRRSVAVLTADSEARFSSTNYDAQGQFPQVSWNPLYHGSYTEFDRRFGALTRLTDANQRTSTWTYDDFGRKTREVYPDGTQVQWEYHYCAGVSGGTAQCPPNGRYLIRSTPLGANGVASASWKETFYDQLEREIGTATLGFDGVTPVNTSMIYDIHGRVAHSSRPYFATEEPVWTDATYDTLGRITAITQADASVAQFAYDGLSSTLTNALNQTRVQESDALGQIVRITDAANGSMSYVYDPFGNLIQTRDPSGNVITMRYDLRGNQIRRVDADSGVVRTQYNALGEVTQQIDAKGQVTRFGYDRLGRLVIRAAPETSSRWVFDLCPYGVGSLCESTGDMADPTGELFNYPTPWYGPGVNQTYDRFGRSIGTETTIDSIYSSSLSYDTHGRIATLTYPTGLTLNYLYNSAGFLQELREGQSNALIWRADSRDAEGRLLRQTYGNNAVTAQTYDARSGRLANQFSMAASVVQDTAYTYYPSGDLQTRTDASLQVTERFSYDNLRRLSSASRADAAGSTTMQSFSYDVLGNLVQRTDVGRFTYLAPYSAALRKEVVVLYVFFVDRAPDSAGLIFWTNQIAAGNCSLAQLASILMGSAEGQALYPNSMNNQTLIASFYRRALGREADAAGLAFWAMQLDNGASRVAVFLSILGISRNYVAGTLTDPALNAVAMQSKARIENKVEIAEYLAVALRNNDLGFASIPLMFVTDDPTTVWVARISVENMTEVSSPLRLEPNTRPHALSQINQNNGSQRLFEYDLNGNLEREVQDNPNARFDSSQARSVAYTSSDQPSSITSSNATVHFSYGSENQRLQQLGPNGRTIYLHPDNQGGLFYEKFIRPDGQVEHQHFVMVDNQLVAIINQTEAGSVVRYVHQDHLGSIVALTDEAGTVVERFAYDIYGQRRAVPGTANNNLAGSATNRGYTGAEHLDAVGLIHLNGRLLDPATGRFLTADPNIPYPLDSQSFNRYSYVRNNPLSFIDPSGFEDIDSGGSYSALASFGSDLTVSISSARSSINNVTNSIANSGLFNWDFSGISSYSNASIMSNQPNFGPANRTAAAPNTALATTTHVANETAKLTVPGYSFSLDAGESFGRGAVVLGMAQTMAAGAEVAAAIATLGESALGMAALRGSRAAIGGGEKSFFRSMSRSEAEAISNTGKLRGGNLGETFFTDARFRSAERAQSRLSLPRLPEVQMEFRITNSPSYLRNGTRVTPDFGGRGGGREYMSKDIISVEVINVQPY